MANGFSSRGRGGDGAASALGLAKAQLLERGKWPPDRMVAGGNDDTISWRINCPVFGCVVGIKPDLFRTES